MINKLKKKNQWAIFLDLDGTLLNDKSEISEYNKLIVTTLKDMGHKIIITTGRPFWSSERYYKELKLDTFMSNYNSGYIHNPSDLTLLPNSNIMNKDAVFKLMTSKIFEENVANFVLEFKEKILIFSKEIDKAFIKIHTNDDTDNKKKLVFCTDDQPVSNVAECLKKYDWIKGENPFVLSMATTEEKADILYHYISRDFGGYFNARIWFNAPGSMNQNFSAQVEINPKDIDKSWSLVKLAAYYGVKRSNTICFGDGNNDAQILNSAGIGVAMLNSHYTTKQAANSVTDYNNNDDGVGRYLNWYFDLGITHPSDIKK